MTAAAPAPLAEAPLRWDLARTAYSRYGSYMAIADVRADSPRRPAGLAPGLWLMGVHGFQTGRETLRLVPWRDGAELPCRIEVYPSHLRLLADGGSLEICLAEPDCLRVRGRGLGLRLGLRGGSYDFVIPQTPSSWLLNPSSAYLLYSAWVLAGSAQVEGQWAVARMPEAVLTLLPGPDGEMELALRQDVGFAAPAAPAGSFDAALARVAAEFADFARPYRRELPPEWEESVTQAAFLNWSCVVAPRGHLHRPSMLMSKNWMNNIWSWDHAINALALAEAHPALAWDQMLTIFDQQLPNGQLPDFINDAVRLYSYVKPPIHGWILGEMLDRNPWFAERERLAAFYEPLENWTEWWFRLRLPAGARLPEYYHGNDSGWDNGTVFDAGLPAVAPELAAFLVLQMQTLARLARHLGRHHDASRWQERAQTLQQDLLGELWDGRRFVVRNRQGQVADASDSIFGDLPIILGERLPGEVRARLAADVRRHHTAWGLATEHPNSPRYRPDGYWRGPIWAPPTLIVAAGLRAAGESGLAAEVARRFCRLCRHAGAFAENYDALTGAPLCDLGYTWTASVFLDLLRRGGLDAE